MQLSSDDASLPARYDVRITLQRFGACRMKLFSQIVILACSISPFAVFADEPPAVDFSRDVLPILSNKCFICHGPDSAGHGDDMLRLDSFEGASAERDGQKAIDPDQLQNSILLKRIHSADDPMPPADAEKQLTELERETLTRWVSSGGEYARHWAYILPQAVVPDVTNETPTPQEPDAAIIDAFISRQHKKRGVDFAPEAERATLARRVSLTLTGLPPEPAALQEFLNDTSDDAYNKFIDQQMNSPRFGEHQARYWLDAVRYGDTHGLHLDNRRGIYPYRDWVVRAFNKNMPLDQFIVEQLAGDLLPNPTLSTRVATGFVRMNPTTSEGGAIPAEFQAKNNFDRTETLGTVLLGMSLTCVRCHTHKYDPILHTEYYQLLAFFNSTAESPMDGNKYDYGPVLKAPSDQSGWDRWDELQRLRRQLLVDVRVAVNSGAVDEGAVDAFTKATAAEQLETVADPSGPFAAQTALQARAADLQAQFKALEESFTTTLVAQDLLQPRPTYVLRRGEYNLPIGEALLPGVPAVLGSLPPDVPANRLGLARWLTYRDNPLVARVLVNRIWQQVFGYGLVRTPEDFGLQGEQPTHPELLDWLALRLQSSRWDRNHLLKLMLHSRTFKQSSAWRTDVEDPENRLFARATSYRLDAEVLRDTGLWASGMLDAHMGGEGVKPYQPTGMWKALAHPASNTKLYEPDSGKRLYRRSLYVYWKRTSPHPMMTLFDAPDRESSCVRRSRSNTSLQSLGLLNETQRIEMSRKLAERLIVERSDDTARLNLLFTLLASREPTTSERAACDQLLKSMTQRYSSSPKDAAALLSIGEVARNEELNAVEVAAWSQVVTTVLASDAAILLY
ncbi:Planctomycete cytochrome C [Fuerstiella marisgermanici]|uniref:Planctomycete cytochrome C n=2 Tax=Fuerstiella marisgermanici TaxID=1891926 RepID=A0A1P8WCC7_9PLAN|nr:Planctomycete cytochrome C [Fuerstiella marisgermanici]